MDLRKILCPTDFSDLSRAALGTAAALARESGAELILLYSADSTDAVATESYGLEEPSLDEYRKRLDETDVPGGATNVRRLVVEGDPGAAIVDVAREENVDMVVLSTHGRTGLSRLLMGSVAEYVVRHADRPVLTVRAAAAAPVGA